MNKRSYLDQLNTGRQRRSGSSIDDLGRTLDAIGSRLDQSLSNAQPRAPMRRDERSRAERLAADEDRADKTVNWAVGKLADDAAKTADHEATDARS